MVQIKSYFIPSKLREKGFFPSLTQNLVLASPCVPKWSTRLEPHNLRGFFSSELNFKQCKSLHILEKKRLKRWFFLLFNQVQKRITRNVPNSYSLIKRCWNEQIFARMKSCTHDIMIVSGQNAYTTSRLPIPNSNSLVIWCGEDPWIFMMKHCKREKIISFFKNGITIRQ